MVLTTAISGLALTLPAERLHADDLGKVIVGGAILCAVTGCLKGRSQSGNQHRTARPAGNPTVRADQQALNYFGYDAGGADGVTGKRTRSAISRYQGYMGYPVTGQLDTYQRQTLVGAYNWAQSGGNATYPGIQGQELLRAYASHSRGGNYCQETGRCMGGGYPAPNNYGGTPGYPGGNGLPPQTGYGATGNMPAPAYPQPMPPLNAAPLPTQVMTTGGALAGFELPDSSGNRSITDHCQTVKMVSSANGGPVRSPASIVNPTQALDEQFCSASTYAVSSTERMLSGAQVTDEQLTQNCGQVVDFMAAETDALGTRPAADLLATAQQKIRQAAPDGNTQVLVQTGEVCLGYGYRTDEADVVLAASMLLVGAGARPYAELLGHHLRDGLGVQADAERARKWYETAFSSLDDGAAPVFLPSQSAQRVEIMRAALAGGAPAPVLTGASSAGAAPAPSALPSFNIGN
ncbi:peptidoglycan-binding domain-containing protein [Rhodovulum sp. MB263]|uniref:peptidoglycan-binding domain-containing protein n=1 Tax=Rhodovulum sp. (strain MB263) TaxID=308754 RepID=UPI0018C88624|nr:peptidoglycan-binding domain-containing protein [Rhodovulum sp. MB263]